MPFSIEADSSYVTGYTGSAFFRHFSRQRRSDRTEMGASALPVIAFTLLWGAVVFLGVALPLFVPKGPNRGILQVLLVLTGFTCWLFWLCCYMAQMNPLIGPKLENVTILVMAREWGNPVSD